MSGIFDSTITNAGNHDSRPHVVIRIWYMHADLKVTHKPAVFKPRSVKMTKSFILKGDEGGVRKQEG